MITNLEVNLAKNPVEREEIHNEVELLRSKKSEIMQNPDILVTKNRNPKQTSLCSNMKKTKSRGMYTVSAFKVKEFSQDDCEATTEDVAWHIPTPSSERRAAFEMPNLFLESAAQLAASRRPSLPVVLDAGNQGAPTISLPPPFRRHSMDSLMVARAVSTPALRSGMTVDMTQKLPAFNFSLSTHCAPSVLPCIEPKLSGPSAAYPDWFLAEKSRVLGQ